MNKPKLADYRTPFCTPDEAVSEWIMAHDEQVKNGSSLHDADPDPHELALAWELIFGRVLADEPEETQIEAWSSLCESVL